MASLERLAELAKMDTTIEANSQGFDSESFRFSQQLLDSNKQNIRKDFTNDFWAFFDNELSLTNLTEKDVDVIMEILHIAQLDEKMASPDYTKSYSDMRDYGQMRAKIFAKLKRSTGGLQRERALIASQIRQLLTNETAVASGGIMNKIGSMFGGKRY